MATKLPPNPHIDATRWQQVEWDHSLKKALDWGYYTPTLTNIGNVAASTAYETMWFKVGDMVTVSGVVDIDPTAATAATYIGITLPVASKMSQASYLNGVCKRQSNDQVCGVMSADTTNFRATLYFYNDADVAARAWTYSFTYRIV